MVDRPAPPLRAQRGVSRELSRVQSSSRGTPKRVPSIARIPSAAQGSASRRTSLIQVPLSARSSVSSARSRGGHPYNLDSLPPSGRRQSATPRRWSSRRSLRSGGSRSCSACDEPRSDVPTPRRLSATELEARHQTLGRGSADLPPNTLLTRQLPIHHIRLTRGHSPRNAGQRRSGLVDVKSSPATVRRSSGHLPIKSAAPATSLNTVEEAALESETAHRVTPLHLSEREASPLDLGVIRDHIRAVTQFSPPKPRHAAPIPPPSSTPAPDEVRWSCTIMQALLALLKELARNIPQNEAKERAEAGVGSSAPSPQSGESLSAGRPSFAHLESLLLSRSAVAVSSEGAPSPAHAPVARATPYTSTYLRLLDQMQVACEALLSGYHPFMGAEREEGDTGESAWIEWIDRICGLHADLRKAVGAQLFVTLAGRSSHAAATHSTKANDTDAWKAVEKRLAELLAARQRSLYAEGRTKEGAVEGPATLVLPPPPLYRQLCDWYYQRGPLLHTGAALPLTAGDEGSAAGHWSTLATQLLEQIWGALVDLRGGHPCAGLSSRPVTPRERRPASSHRPYTGGIPPVAMSWASFAAAPEAIDLAVQHSVAHIQRWVRTQLSALGQLVQERDEDAEKLAVVSMAERAASPSSSCWSSLLGPTSPLVSEDPSPVTGGMAAVTSPLSLVSIHGAAYWQKEELSWLSDYMNDTNALLLLVKEALALSLLFRLL